MKNQEEQEGQGNQQKENIYKLVRLYFEKLVKQEEIKEVKRSRRKRYRNR
ncbi:hypothetical protein [Bacillus wiedmannii]|nr:hypothetical protein [Bacillus wiedmannii]